jgi:AcrR family transcriptional regulator
MKTRSIRQDIIDTAARLFYRQGYCNTGINQIIEEADIAKTSLYQYFQSKEELLIAYLEEAGRRTFASIEEALALVDSPEDKVIAVFDHLERGANQKEYYGCSFLNLVYEIPADAEKVRDKIRSQKDAVRRLFADLLRPAGKEGLADEMYTLFDGALIGNKVYGEAWPITTARAIAKKIL